MPHLKINESIVHRRISVRQGKNKVETLFLDQYRAPYISIPRIIAAQPGGSPPPPGLIVILFGNKVQGQTSRVPQARIEPAAQRIFLDG